MPMRSRLVRHRKHRLRGGAVMQHLKSFLSKAHGFVKNQRLVSKGLRHFGHPKLAALSGKLGYGRRMSRRGSGLRLAGRGLRSA